MYLKRWPVHAPGGSSSVCLANQPTHRLTDTAHNRRAFEHVKRRKRRSTEGTIIRGVAGPKVIAFPPTAHTNASFPLLWAAVYTLGKTVDF